MGRVDCESGEGYESGRVETQNIEAVTVASGEHRAGQALAQLPMSAVQVHSGSVSSKSKIHSNAFPKHSESSMHSSYFSSYFF